MDRLSLAAEAAGEAAGSAAAGGCTWGQARCEVSQDIIMPRQGEARQGGSYSFRHRRYMHMTGTGYMIKASGGAGDCEN